MICEQCMCDAREQKAAAAGLPYTCELESCSGHDGCKGCTCQHLPVGSVEFLGSDPSRSV